MDVPNQVKEILLLDALDYSLLETINEYNNKTKFDFNYRVDLTSFDKDTVLNYIIKVTDKDARSFNRGIRISVKRFSFPEIKLIGGSSIALAAPAYNVKGKISTGLNLISSVKVLFEGEEQYSFVPQAGEELHEMDLKALVFLGDLDPSQQYTIDIVIADNMGQESTTNITVRKSEFVKKPYRINYLNTSGIIIHIEPTYNEDGNIVAFDYKWTNNGNNYRNEFHYNDQKMIDTVLYRSLDADGNYSRDWYTYINYVEGTKQISTIESQSFEYDGGNVSVGSVDVEASSFVYTPEGTVSSFRTSSTVSNVYYSDPFNLGESVFGEYWQLASYMTNNASRRQHREEYDPILIPTFIEGLPPFYDYNSSVFLNVFNDIFWHKYMMTKTVPTDPTYTGTFLREPSFTYETDDEGNIISILKTYTSGGSQFEGKTERYTFFYD